MSLDLDEPHECVGYAVYRNPRALPGVFVVHAWYDRGDDYGPDPRPAGFGRTLEEVRRQIPPGLIHVGREPHDPPSFVESWTNSETTIFLFGE